MRAWQELECRLRSRGEAFDYVFTPGPGTVTQVARQCIRNGCERIIAVGGDGTIREVASAIAGARCKFGIVPCGTGNDFARTLGLPLSIEELVPALTGNHTITADIGLVNGEYFVNVAGAGIDACIVDEVNRSKVIVNGTVTYLAAAVKMLLRYDSPMMRVTIDGREIRGRTLVVAVGNGKYYGGGIKMTPGALVDDGKFHVVVARDICRLEAFRLLPLTYSGRHVLNPKVGVYTGSEVRVEADRPLSVQADGTVVGGVPATFKLVPGALKILAS